MREFVTASIEDAKAILAAKDGKLIALGVDVPAGARVMFDHLSGNLDMMGGLMPESDKPLVVDSPCEKSPDDA